MEGGEGRVDQQQNNNDKSHMAGGRGQSPGDKIKNEKIK